MDWKSCTNCDGEGGWFEDSDTWIPCSECDGVGGWNIMTDLHISYSFSNYKNLYSLNVN